MQSPFCHLPTGNYFSRQVGCKGAGAACNSLRVEGTESTIVIFCSTLTHYICLLFGSYWCCTYNYAQIIHIWWDAFRCQHWNLCYYPCMHFLVTDWCCSLGTILRMLNSAQTKKQGSKNLYTTPVAWHQTTTWMSHHFRKLWSKLMPVHVNKNRAKQVIKKGFRNGIMKNGIIAIPPCMHGG